MSVRNTGKHMPFLGINEFLSDLPTAMHDLNSDDALPTVGNWIDFLMKYFLYMLCFIVFCFQVMQVFY